MYSLIKVLVILFVTAVVAGCKVAVIVVEGGEVQSIGSGTCLEGTICIVEVNDTNFSETFTAVPNLRWRFVKWNSGEGFFCGDSTNPRCVLSTVEFDGNEGIETIIASDQSFYLMPIFEPIFEPVLGTVTVDGKEWAQVDSFANLSWNDINAVCPEGVCSGVLNGYDMTGWTWASFDDVSALFNHYIVTDEAEVIQDCRAGDEFINDGWRTMLNDRGYRFYIAGFLDSKSQDEPGKWAIARFANYDEYHFYFADECRVQIDYEFLAQDSGDFMGAFFWRMN